MGIEAILSVNANMTFAVGRIHSCGGYLSAETIKRLKALGIDPSTVKTEAEAQTLIAQEEKKQGSKRAQQTQQVQLPQKQTPEVDMKQLHLDIKDMGKLLGIDTTTIKDLKDIVDKFEVVVKEILNAASAQVNKGISPQYNSIQKGIRVSTGVDVVEKPENVQADFKSIKDRVEKLEKSKNAMFCGQDMLGMLNRMALGI